MLGCEQLAYSLAKFIYRFLDVIELNYHYISVKYYPKYNFMRLNYGGKIVTLHS